MSDERQDEDLRVEVVAQDWHDITRAVSAAQIHEEYDRGPRADDAGYATRRIALTIIVTLDEPILRTIAPIVAAQRAPDLRAWRLTYADGRQIEARTTHLTHITQFVRRRGPVTFYEYKLQGFPVRASAPRSCPVPEAQ